MSAPATLASCATTRPSPAPGGYRHRTRTQAPSCLPTRLIGWAVTPRQSRCAPPPSPHTNSRTPRESQFSLHGRGHFLRSTARPDRLHHAVGVSQHSKVRCQDSCSATVRFPARHTLRLDDAPSPSATRTARVPHTWPTCVISTPGCAGAAIGLLAVRGTDVEVYPPYATGRMTACSALGAVLRTPTLALTSRVPVICKLG
jgi:hypothetical protein